MNKSVLSMCAGPLLLALAAKAGPNDDYNPPATTPSPTTEIYPDLGEYYEAEVTPEPVVDTPAPSPDMETTSGPTEYYVETTEDGDMEKMPMSDGGSEKEEEEEEEPIPMENPEDGMSCSTYDEDVDVANILPETCEWNTYMCCWTGHDGSGGMYGNTDVCRVLDYPEEGDVLELPRDDEGPVYCHGFAWADGADIDSHILPLYHYVTNVNRTDEGGYYGNVEGVPSCGCIEDMPVVSDAACSRFGREGIEPCGANSLRSHYKNRLDEPKGELEYNLVRECDNEDVPDYDFRTCSHNTYMCCWTENDGQGMADNTDVCRVIDYPSMGETTEYPGESEGEVHCHGFVWPEDATDKYIHLLAQFVQHFDHRDRRGYFGNIEGAPMCGCIEEMPQVSEADCTTYDNEPGREGKFTACTKNDLRTRYEEEYPMGELDNLVGECDNAEA
ncbi:conserved unknown protein [Ectocarpus siliculosus]|uniref:EsV-1-166 n=1 Tax=Ectocarpus siliculosus TaxID=2880 RepID=D7G2N1_ECTSI|nr:conserved unknown protein [Ectocarpus siliculosus]|eukprot:CBJ26856.1 conserved unknown protein [Ectocarpus siliculosus]